MKGSFKVSTRKAIPILILGLAALLFASGYSLGASITWTGTTDTDWSTATNWNPQQVPTSSDDVTIPSGAANDPAIDTEAAVARTLTIQSGATLTISGGSLTVGSGGLTFAGTITATGGTITVSGDTTISNGGNLQFGATSSATVTLNAVTIESGGQISVNASVGTNATLTLNSDVTSSGTIDLYADGSNYATLSLGGDVTISISGSSNEFGPVSGNRTLALSGSGSVGLYGAIAGSLSVGSSATAMVKGTVSISGNATISGTLETVSPGALTVSGSTTLNGTLQFGEGSSAAGDATLSTTTIGTSGQISVANNATTGATLTLNGNVTSSGTIDLYLDGSNYVTLSPGGDITVSISGQNNQFAAVSISGYDLTLSGSGKVELYGNLTIANSNSSFTMGSGVLLYVKAASTSIDNGNGGSFTSNGYIEFNADTTLEVGTGTTSLGNTKITAGNTVTLATDGSSSTNTLTLTDSFTILGTFQNDHDGTPANYDKLVIVVTAGKTITVGDGGALTLTGDNSNYDRIIMKSSQDPSQGSATWTLSVIQSSSATTVSLTSVAIADSSLSTSGSPTITLSDVVNAGGCSGSWLSQSNFNSPYPNGSTDPGFKADSPSDTTFDLDYGNGAGDWNDTKTYEVYLAPVSTYRRTSSSDPVATAGLRVMAYYGSTYSDTVDNSQDYKLDVSNVPPGTYYVYMRVGTVSDDDYYYIVSPYAVKVARALFLSSGNDEPLGDDDVAGVSFTIEWTDDDEAYGLAGTIDIYYASVNTLTTASEVESQGTLIVSGIDENETDSNNPGYGNTYTWTPSGVAAGTYYIYLVWKSGSVASVDVSGSIEVQSASIKITRPYSDNITASGGYFTIEWSDSAADGVTGAEIYLFYSTSTNLANSSSVPKALTSTEISSLVSNIDSTGQDTSKAIQINSTGISLDNDGAYDRYVWNLSSVSNGNYYIYALVKLSGSYIAGYGPSGYTSGGSSYAKYVTVSHTPFIVVTSPAKDIVVSSTFTIRWQDKWDGGDGTVELYYSTNGSYTTVSDIRNNATLITSGLSEGGSNGSYTWTGVSSLPVNTAYYIYAVLEAGSTDAWAVSPGTIKRSSDFTVQIISDASDPAVGDTFTVSIKIDTQSTNIQSAAIYLSFNPSYINLVSESSPFTCNWSNATTFKNSGSNTDGTADLVVATTGSGSSFTTSTTFATVQFTVVQAGNTNVMLSPESSGRVTTFVDSSGVKHYPVASQIVSSTSLGTISGKVTLEGRTNHSALVTFELRKPGSLGNTDDWTVPDGLDEDSDTPGVQVTTRSDGSFVLTNVPTGKWILTAKAKHYLRGQATVIVKPGNVTEVTSFTTTDNDGNTLSSSYLVGGECFDSTYLEDNDVDIDDLTVFANNFGSTDSDALEAADINGDGLIDLDDFVMIASNWNEDGIDPDSSTLGVANGDYAPATAGAEASIELVGLPERMKLGQEYRVLVIGHNLQNARGYSFDLGFDPKAVEIQAEQGELMESGSFPLFISKVKGDKLMVASALTGKNIKGASGDVVLAVLKVKPIQTGGTVFRLQGGHLMPVNGRSVPIETVARSVRILKPSDRFALYQNYPNPFNPETWIPYALKEDSYVQIRIYDSTGKLIRVLDQGYREAAQYVEKGDAAYWDGRNETGERVSSGVYFYQIVTDKFTATRKMVILK